MAKKKRAVTLQVSGVSMEFNLSQEKVDTLKDSVINFFTHHHMQRDDFWALRDIDFSLEKGDRVGILGLNGSGKSTLLKVIAGVYRPPMGSVTVKGKIAPLLELGAGFEKQYTARENIYLYGSVLGYKKEFVESKFDEIIEFAELDQFVDVPLKNYSSGMKSRLGFAICTAVSPDILILDEVLSVGDARFRTKSEAKILSMFATGVTVLFVSHNLAQVKRLCNKALILDHGQMVAFGDIEDVAPIYEGMITGDKLARRIEKKKRRRRVVRQAKVKNAVRMKRKLGLTAEEAMNVVQVPKKRRENFLQKMKDKEERMDRQRKKARQAEKAEDGGADGKKKKAKNKDKKKKALSEAADGNIRNE